MSPDIIYPQPAPIDKPSHISTRNYNKYARCRLVFLFRCRSSVSSASLSHTLRGGKGPASSQTNLKTIITTNLRADLTKPDLTSTT